MEQVLFKRCLDSIGHRLDVLFGSFIERLLDEHGSENEAQLLMRVRKAISLWGLRPLNSEKHSVHGVQSIPKFRGQDGYVRVDRAEFDVIR